MKDHFTLEQKVGQLFVLGFQGYELDRETRALLEVIRPGGFLLFQRNIESFDCAAELRPRTFPARREPYEQLVRCHRAALQILRATFLYVLQEALD